MNSEEKKMSNNFPGAGGILPRAILATLEAMLHEFFNHLDTRSIHFEDTLETDLGLDSLDQVSLLIDIEDKFKLEIEDETAEKIMTVGDLVYVITKALEARGQTSVE